MALFDREKTACVYRSLFEVFALTIGLISFYGCDSEPDTDSSLDDPVGSKNSAEL
jgi:hypothetical protein